VSADKMDTARRRNIADVCGACWRRMRLASSVKVTSNTQCNWFSIDQCWRMSCAIRFACGGHHDRGQLCPIRNAGQRSRCGQHVAFAATAVVGFDRHLPPQAPRPYLGGERLVKLRGHRLVKLGLIIFQRQQILAAAVDDLLGNLFLATHRIERDGAPPSSSSSNKSGMAVISLDFASTATCPKVSRVSLAQALTKCKGERPAAVSNEPRRVLSSMSGLKIQWP
jgi:hypothetical protein